MGFHFKVITYHNSLKWWHNFIDPTGRLARWSLGLLEYVFEILHRKEVLHQVLDTLSRVTEEQEIPTASVRESNDPEMAESTDPWYQRRVEAVRSKRWIFPDWNMEMRRFYRH